MTRLQLDIQLHLRQPDRVNPSTHVISGPPGPVAHDASKPASHDASAPPKPPGRSTLTPPNLIAQVTFILRFRTRATRAVTSPGNALEDIPFPQERH